MEVRMIEILVRERKSTAVIGIGTILFGIVVGASLWYFRRTDSSLRQLIPACLAVLCMILSGIIFCLVYKNRRLHVEDGKLCYNNWLGWKKEFSLKDIGYCRLRESLVLYDVTEKKLCKLDFGMTQVFDFLQYLLDNGVEVESNRANKGMLDVLFGMQTIRDSEVVEKMGQIEEEAGRHRQEWEGKADKLGASFRIGFACYLESELREDRQLWEQASPVDNWLLLGDEWSAAASDRFADGLPEGFLIALEGYLQKDGEYVMNRKEQAICLVVPVIHVIKSYQIGKGTKTILYEDSFGEWKKQIEDLLENLPKHRYHTAQLVLRHNLKVF